MLTRRSCRSIVRRRQNSPRDFNRIVPTILQDSQDSPGSNSSWDSSQWAPMSLRCQSLQGVGGEDTDASPAGGAFAGAFAPTDAAVRWDLVGGGEEAGGRDRERVMALGFALSICA